MEKSMSRMLVETVVKQALKTIRENPERGIRNLIDMALQFAVGRFQKHFFATAQTMLQNENSAYYALVRDTVAHTDTDRLFTFGMNVGYNSCTTGARMIRLNEDAWNCNIPWAIILELDAQTDEEKEMRYHELIREGEESGVYTWMIFSLTDPQAALSLAAKHADSAFCIFCSAEDLTEACLEEAAEFPHVMLVLRYDETVSGVCRALREKELLYSVWYPYGQKDTEIIINGDLFSDAQQVSPVFTVLVPEKSCPKEVRRLAYQETIRARAEQSYRTIVWDLQGDNCFIDTIISGDACTVCFDKQGAVHTWSGKYDCGPCNLFTDTLADILMCVCAKSHTESGNNKTG